MAQKPIIAWTKKGLQSLVDEAVYRAQYIGETEANLFQQEVLDYCNEKLTHPERYAPCRFRKLQKAGFRCLQFQKNWIVVYRIENSNVTVYGIANAKRHPSVFEGLID